MPLVCSNAVTFELRKSTLFVLPFPFMPLATQREENQEGSQMNLEETGDKRRKHQR